MVAVLNRNQTKKGVAMQSTTCSLTVALPSVPFLFSPLSLYARLLALTDQRDPRGVRYPLAALLTIATLAKLAEQNAPRAIADWAQLRAPTLADLSLRYFGLGVAPPTLTSGKMVADGRLVLRGVYHRSI